jgi:zinc and cadmium transporter
MTALPWIVGGGVLMSAIALIGGVTSLVGPALLERLLLPLVAFAAGSLIGSAIFHMLPAALAVAPTDDRVWLALLAGFCTFFAIEQLLHWHHCRRAGAHRKRPLTYLILIGDALHNFIGGLAIAGTFLIDVRLGVTAWLAAAMHEVPQELGDFGVLVHGGWPKRQALLFNALSGSTFLLGGLVTYGLSRAFDVWFLLPFAAGNFLYIGAVDLVPEVNKTPSAATNLVHFAAFVFGAGLMYAATALD